MEDRVFQDCQQANVRTREQHTLDKILLLPTVSSGVHGTRPLAVPDRCFYWLIRQHIPRAWVELDACGEC